MNINGVELDEGYSITTEERCIPLFLHNDQLDVVMEHLKGLTEGTELRIKKAVMYKTNKQTNKLTN